jgi:hypothetical protein
MVTTVDFGANYFVIGVHERAWDYYDTTKARSSPAAPALKVLPVA